MKTENKPKEELLVLPAAETQFVTRSWQWLHGLPMFFVWSALYIGLFLLFIGGHWIWLRRLNYNKNLIDDLRERKQKCDKIIGAQKFSLAAAEMINATYYLLSRLIDQDGFNKDLSDLLEQLPPSVRTEVSEPLRKELEVLQTIAFAPAEAWKTLSTTGELKKHSDRTFQILEQTLRLAEEGA